MGIAIYYLEQAINPRTLLTQLSWREKYCAEPCHFFCRLLDRAGGGIRVRVQVSSRVWAPWLASRGRRPNFSTQHVSSNARRPIKARAARRFIHDCSFFSRHRRGSCRGNIGHCLALPFLRLQLLFSAAESHSPHTHRISTSWRRAPT